MSAGSRDEPDYLAVDDFSRRKILPVALDNRPIRHSDIRNDRNMLELGLDLIF